MYLTVAFVIFDQAMTGNSGRERDDRSKKATRAKQDKGNHILNFNKAQNMMFLIKF